MLEAISSMIMVRGGIKQADMKIVWGLVIGSAIGLPIGLYATTHAPVETSRLIALILLLSLAFLQIFKVRLAILATRSGLYLSGILSGIATGLASIGGMVVALYVLSQEAQPRQMRASLIMYLCIGMITSLVFQTYYDMLNLVAFKRALVFAPCVIAGVLAGSWCFRPSLEKFYKRFCLLLLIALAGFSLSKMIWQ